VKFGFVAKHRGVWPADWLCGALGVSRGGFYAWLTRPRSRRSRSEEELGAKVRASFLASDRTYGARRVWHDLLAEGVSCGLHRIERLMRLQALKARPRRRRLPPDLDCRPKKRSGRHAVRLRRDGITARLSCSFNFLTIRGASSGSLALCRWRVRRQRTRGSSNSRRRRIQAQRAAGAHHVVA
jgi:transposase InsO family protein